MLEVNKAMSEMEAQCLMERLKKGDDQVFKELYVLYSADFIDWAQFHFSLDKDEALDIFQETITNLYLNVYSGKLQELKSTPKTYIYAIGKNHIYKRHHTTFKALEFHNNLPDCVDETMNIIDNNFYNDDKTLKVADSIKKIGEPCQSLLEFVYLKQYPYEVITEKLGYKNINVLKAKKWRCLKQLRHLFKY